MKHPPQGLPVSIRRQSVQSFFTEGTQNFLGGIDTKGLSKIWGGGKQGLLYGRCANGEIQNKNNQIHVNKVYHVRQTNDSFPESRNSMCYLNKRLSILWTTLVPPKGLFFTFITLGSPLGEVVGGFT